MEKSPDRISGKKGKWLHNQWEIRNGKFDVGNPAWNGFVGKVAGRAVEDLGVKADAGIVKADMERVRLWKVGACLPAHKECVCPFAKYEMVNA